MIPATTALVAARPTSAALRPARNPMWQPASATRAPNVTLLIRPIANCLPATASCKLDEERARCDIEGRNPDDIPAQQSDGTTVQVEQRHHGDERDHAGQHQEVEGRDAESLERIDLLVALHGGDVRGIGAARASRHDDRRHDRRQLPHHGNADEVRNIDAGAEAAELHCTDEGDDGADEAVADRDDQQGAGAGLPHKLQHIHGAGARSAGQRGHSAQRRLADEGGRQCDLRPCAEEALADPNRHGLASHLATAGLRPVGNGCQSEQPPGRLREG